MKISERIMSQLEEPAAGDDSWVDGFVSATESADQIATEADALMAEMADKLKWYAEEFCEYSPNNTGCGKYHDGICAGCKAQTALKNYREYVI